MAPVMMDPVHAAVDAVNIAPVSPNSYHQLNNGFGDADHNGYRGDQGRHFNTPSLYKGDTRLDAEPDRSCMVWVNGLNQNMSEHALIEGLRQFGTVVSCVRKNDGKSPNGSQYAFIRYTSPQEAQYAISVGEVDIHGCRVMIKSRNTSRAQRHNSHGSSDYKPYDRSGQPVLGMINKNNHGPSAAFDGNPDPQHGNGQRSRVPSGGPPVLMSKALIVSNLPQDMCPKGFYTLFSEVGPVDGCYIFPHLDHAGRRFGHIVMTSFYMAQKSVEMFHGRSVHGCILDVRYLKSVPTSPEPEPLPMVSPPPGMPLGPHQSRVMFNPPSPSSQPFYHQPQPPLPIGWPQQPAMGNVSPGNYGVPPPFGIPPPPPMLQVFNGQGHVFNQPAVGFPGYTSPPLPQMSPSPIPEMRWSVTPERKQFPNNRQHRRYPPPPPGLGGAIPYPRAFSSGSPSDIQTRGISNTNSNINVESSLPPVERSKKQEYENRFPEQHNSGLVAEVIGDTGCDIPSNTATVSPVLFEIISAPVIPETSKPMDPCNLFVKNLDDGIISTSEDLKGIFEPFGPVASAHLATFNESKISKGFGFVAFTKPEDAAKAKEKINNSLVGKKRVFVSYAERKEDRAKRLKSLFSGSSTNPEDEEVSNGAKDKERIVNVADPIELSQPKDEEQVSSTSEEPSGALSPASGSEDQASSATVPELSSADLDKNNTTPVASTISPPLGEVHVQNGEGSQSGDKQNGPLGTTEGSTNITGSGQAAKAEAERLSEPQHPGGKPTNNQLDTNDLKAISEEDLVHDASNMTLDSLQTRHKNLPPSADVVIKGQLATKVGAGGNKRSSKKGLSSQKVSGTQVQVAVPNIRNSNSFGRTSSRIPVQNKNTNLPTNSTGPRLNIDASQNPSPSNTIPSKKRGYKGNRGGGRNSDRIGKDGVSSQKNLVDKQDVGKSVAGQVGITVAAH